MNTNSEPAIAEGEREAFCNKCGFFGVPQRGGFHFRPADGQACNYAAALAQSSTPPASKGVESVHTKGPLVVGDNRLQAKRNMKWGPCPECGVGAPGHEGDCSHAPVAILGPREPVSPTPSNDTLQGRGEVEADDGLEDEIAEAIDDSLDMDWTGSIGARHVMDLLRRKGIVL